MLEDYIQAKIVFDEIARENMKAEKHGVRRAQRDDGAVPEPSLLSIPFCKRHLIESSVPYYLHAP